MEALQQLAALFPDAANDIRLNLLSVLQPSTLNDAQRFGVALAVAHASRSQALVAALVAAGGAAVSPAVAGDAQAAASLMTMNNVYYRFRHMVGKADYEAMPSRLRMQRMAVPAGNKLDFELMALAVSAINACSTCLQAHEQVVIAGGLSTAQVHDAVRIAAVVHAAAMVLAMAAPIAA